MTLAVGMSLILTRRRCAGPTTRRPIAGLMKYWYHFAIMFEALFILTTIDAGTRIARFLLQEALGKVYQPFERTDWLPGAVLATAAGDGGLGRAGLHRLDRHDLADVAYFEMDERCR